MDIMEKIVGIVFGLVTLGFGLAIGIAMVAKLRETQTPDSAEYNASGDIINGILIVVTFIGVIVLAALAAPLLGLVKGASKSMSS